MEKRVLKTVFIFFAFILLSAISLEAQKSTEDEKEFEITKKAANKGDAYAQYRLGRCYFMGNGVTKNYESAVYWYKKAAKNGVAGAKDAVLKLNKLGYY